MKPTWTLTFLLVGLAAGIITFLITHHWILSLVSFVAATVLVNLLSCASPTTD